MSHTPRQKCRATTQRGTPCKNWSVPGSEPPLCAVHARARAAAPPHPDGGRFYDRALDPQDLADLVAYAQDLTLEEELACARVALRRVLDALSGPRAEALTPNQYARMAELVFRGTRTIAQLLRDGQALSERSNSALDSVIDEALDELSAEWGIEL